MLSFLFLAAPLVVNGYSERTVDFGFNGKQRSYVEWRPTGPTPAKPALILSFHGLSDKCDHFGGSCGTEHPECDWLKELDKRQNFYFIRPCSFHRSWNAGMCCEPSGGPVQGKDSGPRDLDFAREIVRRTLAKYPEIDSTRVFSVGFSNGGMMSETLACNGTEPIFKGICSVEGVVEIRPGNMGALDQCDIQYKNHQRPVSILKIHGAYDPAVPLGGDSVLGFPSSKVDFQRWAKRNGCGTQLTLTADKFRYRGHKYNNCANDATVEMVIKEEIGHKWTITNDWSSTQYCLNWLMALK